MIDLLPDRESATVAAWLAARPSIEIIARDRGGSYGAAADQGRPEEPRVADRWHLFENASAAFLSAVRRQMSAIRAALGQGPVDPSVLTAAERLQHQGWRRRAEADAAVLALRNEGVAIKEIVRRTGRARKVVRDIVRGDRAEPFRPRASFLEPGSLDFIGSGRPAATMEPNSGGGCEAKVFRALRASLANGRPAVGATRGSRTRGDAQAHVPSPERSRPARTSWRGIDMLLTRPSCTLGDRS